MNNIGKAQKNLKKKLSLDDYGFVESREHDQNIQQRKTGDSELSEAQAQSDQSSGCKIKATYYLSEDDHSALTHVYIKRLQDKKKTDRSALIGEAIRLLYEKEMA